MYFYFINFLRCPQVLIASCNTQLSNSFLPQTSTTLTLTALTLSQQLTALNRPPPSLLLKQKPPSTGVPTSPKRKKPAIHRLTSVSTTTTTTTTTMLRAALITMLRRVFPATANRNSCPPWPRLKCLAVLLVVP